MNVSENEVERIAIQCHLASDKDGHSVKWEKQHPKYRTQKRRMVREVLVALNACGYALAAKEQP